MSGDVPFESLDYSGLLTSDDRKLLLGKKEYSDAQLERRAWMRLRNRVRGWLQDCWFLVHKLPAADRAQIVTDFTAQLPTPESVFRDPELQGLVQAMAFLFGLADAANIEPADLVEYGLTVANREMLDRPHVSPEVSIKLTPSVDESVVEKIQEGEELAWPEYHTLRVLLLDDWEGFLEFTASIELPAVESGVGLSVGESLVLFARSSPGDGTLTAAVDQEVLHPRVVREFLPVVSGYGPADARTDESLDGE